MLCTRRTGTSFWEVNYFQRLEHPWLAFFFHTVDKTPHGRPSRGLARASEHATFSLVTFNVIAANHAPAQLTAYGGQAPALRPAVSHGCLERPDVFHAA
jgi:hypothetical protein